MKMAIHLNAIKASAKMTTRMRGSVADMEKDGEACSMKHVAACVMLLLAANGVALAQDASAAESPFERFQRMITEEPCNKLIPRLDEEYARGKILAAEDSEAYAATLKARIDEYGVTWGLILGYDHDGRLGDEGSEIVETLRSLCEDDPGASLASLMDSLD